LESPASQLHTYVVHTVHTYMYSYMDSYLYTSLHTHILAWFHYTIYASIHLATDLYLYTKIHIHIHVYILSYILHSNILSLSLSICVYIYIYIYLYIDSYSYAHINTIDSVCIAEVGGVSPPLEGPRTGRLFRFVRACDARCFDVRRRWGEIHTHHIFPFSLSDWGSLPFSIEFQRRVLVRPSETK